MVVYAAVYLETAAANQTPRKIIWASILRHTRIYIIRPAQDSSDEILHSPVTGLFQEIDRQTAANSALAMNDYVIRTGQLMQPFGQSRSRHQLRSGYAANRILFRLAHVHEDELVAAIHLGFE